MDPGAPAPNCAICNAPAYPECPCESERLQIAVQQAEKRAMDARLAEIRNWVISRSKAAVLSYFNTMLTQRRTQHNTYLSSLPFYQIYVQYQPHPPLHPAALHHLQQQIADAQADMKRGVDADWRASVLKYPEVLDYFYSLVSVALPADTSSKVVDGPFGAAYASKNPSLVGKEVKRTRRMSGTPAPEPPPASRPPPGRRRDSGGFGPGVRRAPPVAAPTPPVGSAHPGYGYGHY